MRTPFAALLLACAIGAPAAAEDIAAGPPRNLSVTIYRAPDGDAGRIAEQDGGGVAGRRCS